MAVRLEPREVKSRTLIHEVLHLYGAVHINPDLDSIMTPSGSSLDLDPANRAIIELLRRRRFGTGRSVKPAMIPAAGNARTLERKASSIDSSSLPELPDEKGESETTTKEVSSTGSRDPESEAQTARSRISQPGDRRMLSSA